MSTSIGLRSGRGVGVATGSADGTALPPGASGEAAGVGSGDASTSGGSVTSTVLSVARSGTGPAITRSSLATSEIQRSPAPKVSVAIASVVSDAPTKATSTAPTT